MKIHVWGKTCKSMFKAAPLIIAKNRKATQVFSTGTWVNELVLEAHDGAWPGSDRGHGTSWDSLRNLSERRRT